MEQHLDSEALELRFDCVLNCLCLFLVTVHPSKRFFKMSIVSN